MGGDVGQTTRTYVHRKEEGPHATRKDISLHREVLKTDAPHIDHKNHWGGDNRRGNLRPATVSQNQMNKILQRKGYQYCNGIYIARIGYRGKKLYIKNCKTPEEAHAAYVAKAKELYGNYQNLEADNLIPNLRVTGLETNDHWHRGGAHWGSAEHRSHLRAARLGRKASDETRANMRAARGTPEARARNSAQPAWNKGLRATDEARANMSAAQRGRKPTTDATRAKLSAAGKGRKMSPDAVAKSAAARRGMKRSLALVPI